MLCMAAFLLPSLPLHTGTWAAAGAIGSWCCQSNAVRRGHRAGLSPAVCVYGAQLRSSGAQKWARTVCPHSKPHTGHTKRRSQALVGDPRRGGLGLLYAILLLTVLTVIYNSVLYKNRRVTAEKDQVEFLPPTLFFTSLTEYRSMFVLKIF